MVSTVPWSNYTEADYTLQQWHNACLIHLHTGPPTSKDQCKLPVKTPGGVLNKNGVYAATAALAGARTALKAPIEQKAQAARKLIAYYQQFNAKPPPSLFSLGHSIEVTNFLEHHGVKGQKWGIRKEFLRLRQERRDRQAQKFLNKAGDIQKEIDKIQKSGVKRASIKGIHNAIKFKDLTEDKQRAIDNAKRKSEGKLSSKQKKLLIGTAVVGVVLGAYGAYTMTQSGETRRLITKGGDFIKSKFSDPLDPGWKLDKSLADKMSVDEIKSKVVNQINPGYGDVGTKVNCRRATFAYEMRRRGYDVAATKTTDGRGQNPVGLFNALSNDKDIVPQGPVNAAAKVVSEINKPVKPFTDFMQNPRVGEIQVDTPGSIWSELRKQPDRARGELGVFWFGGGGHSMAWEVIDNNPVIIDNQTGEIYKSVAEFDKVANNIVDAGITRLDNKPLNTNFLMRWVRNND